jgi:hypothetical protein
LPTAQDDALPAAKRPRLEASIAADADADADTVVDAHANSTCTASSDDTVAAAPTYTVAVMATFLPSYFERVTFFRVNYSTMMLSSPRFFIALFISLSHLAVLSTAWSLADRVSGRYEHVPW